MKIGHQEKYGLRLILLSTIAFAMLAGTVFAAGLDFEQIVAGPISGSVVFGVVPSSNTSVVENVSIFYQADATTTWTFLGYASSDDLADNDTWNYTWTSSALGDGNYTLSANSSDDAKSDSAATNKTYYINNTHVTLSGISPGGTQTTTALTLTVTTTEQANCYYNATGGIATTAFASTNATIHNQTITGSWGVTSTYNVSCNIFYYPVAENASTLTSFFPGAGGGIVAPMWRRTGITPVTANKQVVSVANIPAGGTGTATITKEALAITEVTFDVVEATSIAKATIEKKDTGPAGITGTVYQYVDMTITETAATNIAGGTVKFKVLKSWYTNNGIDYASTKLYRYVDGAWSELPTSMTTSDGTHYYFEATTPGFSTFAIAAGVAPTTCTDGATQSCTTAENCAGVQTCIAEAWGSCVDIPDDGCPVVSDGEDEEVEAAAFDYTWIIIVIVIVVIIAVAVFYTRGKQYPIRGK